MPKKSSIRYATVIPKGDYITITLIGKKDATKDFFQEFLTLADIQGKIMASEPHCVCSPKITVSPANKPFTHRFVMIGDASFSRHYKNGIESAFLTAKLAAETAIFYGVDATSFKKHYYKQAKRQIIRDNIYGRLLFSVSDFISAVPILAQAHLQLAKKQQESGAPKKIRFILWNMFTGNISYRNIFKTSLDFSLHLSLLIKTIVLFISKLKKNIR